MIVIVGIEDKEFVRNSSYVVRQRRGGQHREGGGLRVSESSAKHNIELISQSFLYCEYYYTNCFRSLFMSLTVNAFSSVSIQLSVSEWHHFRDGQRVGHRGRLAVGSVIWRVV